MGLFGKSSLEDEILLKHLEKTQIAYTKEGNSYTFTLTMDGYSLYPYFQIMKMTEEGKKDAKFGYLSVVINLRNINKESDIYTKMNTFNLSSPFFMAKLKDGVLFLEAKAYVEADSINDAFDDMMSSLKSHQSEIDLL